jgi:peptidoglycan hydrolase-like protein with peptidoglycan-binding domain
MALAQSLSANPSDVPVKDLDAEAESDNVSRLQTALQKLGYIDRVTGYYGPMTVEAVSTFQQDNGIDATGSYGPVTRMALATRMRPPAVADELGPDAQAAVVAPLGFVMFIDAALFP